MSVRRLQKIKGGSYIISVPSEWVRKNNLDVKSELKVYEVYDGLKVKPIKDIKAEKVIEFNDLDTTLYLVSVFYMQGISKIVITSKSPMSSDVKKRLRELQLTHPGLEIVDETFNSVTFNVNFNVTTDLNSLVRGYVEKIKKILNDALVVLQDPKKELKEDLIYRADSLIKDYRGIIRNIALGVQLDDEYNFNLPFKDLILYAIFMRDLGRFVTHFKTFIQLVNDESALVPFSKVVEMFNKATEMFFNENLSNIQWLRNTISELESACSITEACKELVRMASYCIAIMDDSVHKSVRIV